MTLHWPDIFLQLNLLAHAALLLGAVWCIAFPERRIYPMQSRNGWFFGMWALFVFVFLSNPALAVVHWNTGPWADSLRFWLAVPLLLIGIGLTTWGWITLGSKNTSGLRDGFVARGPYAITRNPQYLGDFFIFTGFAIAANSGVAWVTHMLTALVFLLAPAVEEPWLERQYGEDYLRYRRSVSRFL